MISAWTFAIANEKTSDSKTQKNPGLVLPEMVNIPAGSFMMGNINNFKSKEGWTPATDLELPIHKVNIKAFRLGKYEVTGAEFAKFIATANYPVHRKCV